MIPTPGDYYEVGTVVKIKQMLKIQGDAVRVLVEGQCSRGDERRRDGGAIYHGRAYGGGNYAGRSAGGRSAGNDAPYSMPSMNTWN